MTDDIEQLLRNLHLTKIAAIIADELKHAEQHDLSYSAFLARLLRAAIDDGEIKILREPEGLVVALAKACPALEYPGA